MSQQQPPQQMGVQSQQQMGQQPIGQQFAGRLPPQQRAALDTIARAMEACGWCADQCIQEADPNMIRCIQLCEDVVELGEATLAMLPRNSQFAQPVLQAFQQAAQACAQECGQHPHGHCQECASVLGQTLNSTQQLTTGQAMPQMSQ